MQILNYIRHKVCVFWFWSWWSKVECRKHVQTHQVNARVRKHAKVAQPLQETLRNVVQHVFRSRYLKRLAEAHLNWSLFDFDRLILHASTIRTVPGKLIMKVPCCQTFRSWLQGLSIPSWKVIVVVHDWAPYIPIVCRISRKKPNHEIKWEKYHSQFWLPGSTPSVIFFSMPAPWFHRSAFLSVFMFIFITFLSNCSGFLHGVAARGWFCVATWMALKSYTRSGFTHQKGTRQQIQ